MFLRQSTKTSIVLGPFVDDADGKTAETGLTVGSIDVDLYKFSNTVPQAITTAITPNASGSDSGNDNDMVHIANGYYSLELSTGNTDTCGPLKITSNISGALPVWANFHVLEEAIYDALFAASATGELLVDVVKDSGDSTAADNMELMFDGTGYAGGTTKLSVNTTQIEGSDATDQINAACDAAFSDYDPPTKAEMDAMWTTALTESYADKGVAPTPAQFLFMIWSCMSDFSITSTTIASRKIDGSTAAEMEWTIDDATNPTSRTRSD